MLVLTRFPGEKIIINDEITIMVAAVNGEQVRIAIEAPKNIPVHREEVLVKIKRAQELLKKR